MEESPIRLRINNNFWKSWTILVLLTHLKLQRIFFPAALKHMLIGQGPQCICICATGMFEAVAVRGWTSAGQQCERTRQISQRLKAPLPSGGYGQALMLMWTNKRKPEWVEWTIICAGEALSWNGACLFGFQSGQWRGIVEDGVKKKAKERKKHTILLISLQILQSFICVCPKKMIENLVVLWRANYFY